MNKPDDSDSVFLNGSMGSLPDTEEVATTTDWPDPSIYGEPVIAHGKSKKRSYGLYLAFGLGFLFAEILTYFVAMPASFDTGYQAALTDMRAAMEAEGGQ